MQIIKQFKSFFTSAPIKGQIINNYFQSLLYMDFRIRPIRNSSDIYKADDSPLVAVLRELNTTMKETNRFLMQSKREKESTQSILLQIQNSLAQKQLAFRTVEQQIRKVSSSACSSLSKICSAIDRVKTFENVTENVFEAKINSGSNVIQHTNPKVQKQNSSSPIVSLGEQIRQFMLCPMIPRHLEIKIEFQSLKGLSTQFRNSAIKKYITKMTNSIFSISFNMFFKEKIDFEKIKAFCSENILGNLIQLIKLEKLTKEQVGLIDRHLSSEVLEYLQVSYPRSEEKEDSSKLMNMVAEKNIFNESKFDIICNSPVKAMTWHHIVNKYDKDTLYHDETNQTLKQVMRLLNYIIQLPDQKLSSKPDQSITLFEQFESDMRNCFSIVFNKQVSDYFRQQGNKKQILFGDGVNKAVMKLDHVLGANQLLRLIKSKLPKTEVNKKQENEFNQKVKAYTKFKIGRKVSSNCKKYTETEISKGSLNLKDSSIRRIVTKWIEALQENFEKPAESTILRNGLLRLFDNTQNNNEGLQHKQKLFLLFEAAKKSINSKVQNIRQNIYQTFQESLTKPQNEIFSSQFCSQREGAVGNLAVIFSQASESYIIRYLKFLINSLKQIEDKYSEAFAYSVPENEAKPLLVTLKLGDLMRCQLSSKQNEIIAIYEYLMLLCQYSPQIFELVRVKNRFDTPNKDVLINIWYHKRIMVEIQLAIKSESPFLQCSDKFCHFIYELTRDILGPVSQLTTIWSKFSPKALYFEKKYKKILKRSSFDPKPYNKCLPQSQHFYVDLKEKEHLPYWCANCHNFQSSFHRRSKCLYCNKKICALCKNTESISKAHKQKKMMMNDFEGLTIGKVVRGIEIETKEPKLYIFLSFMGKKCVYSFVGERNQQEFSSIKKVFEEQSTIEETYSQFNSFKNRNFLLQQAPNVAKTKIIAQIFAKFWEKQLKSISKKKSKTLSLIFSSNPPIESGQKKQLTEKLLINEQMVKVGNQINNLTIQQNDFTSLQLLSVAKEIKFLSCNLNKVESLEYLPNLVKLQQLQLKNNAIKSLHTKAELRQLKTLQVSFNQLQNLEGLSPQPNLIQLNLYYNQIKTLQKMPQLPSLQVLSLSKNQLTTLKGLPNLQKLSKLQVELNNLQSIQHLPPLPSLQILKLSSNALQSLEGISNIKKLRVINCGYNSINTLKGIPELNMLQDLDLNSNKLTNFQGLPQLEHLRSLYARSNQINDLENLSNLKQLNILDLSYNKLASLKGLSQLNNLKTLDLSSNQIASLEGFPKLPSLKLLYLSYNCLKSVSGFTPLPHLHQLILAQNQIDSLEGMPQLQQLEKIEITHDDDSD